MENRTKEIIDEIEQILDKIRPYINGEGEIGRAHV